MNDLNRLLSDPDVKEITFVNELNNNVDMIIYFRSGLKIKYIYKTPEAAIARALANKEQQNEN